MNEHLAGLVEEGFLEAAGSTRPRSYRRAGERLAELTMPLSDRIQEDELWRGLRPTLGEVTPNVEKICSYGFTEIVNNARDHSEGRHLSVVVTANPDRIEIFVMDDGVGIFEKLTAALGLSHPQQALLEELSKGKLTTDPKRHSSEGIYFSSLAFDRFMLSSPALFASATATDRWSVRKRPRLVVSDDSRPETGTRVTMEISTTSTRELGQVFDAHADAEGAFDRTLVPVPLAAIGKEGLISRSQAKRVLARFEGFREVVLDFAGVDEVDQAFADEIFGVFARAQPDIRVVETNASPQVTRMIHRARNAR